ncbi:MAG: SUMF1/EgtB/PvdO family nonheme iron enzyme [Pseudomonadota bacterium]
MIGAGEMSGDSRCPSGFVYFPTARFMMGSRNGDRDEWPVREIEVSAFCFAEHEATNTEYSTYVAKQAQQPAFNLMSVSCGAHAKSIVAREDSERQLHLQSRQIPDDPNRCNFVIEPKKVPTKLEKWNGYDGPNQPAVGVRWDQARAYCQSIGGDLATEAQWERAARDVFKGCAPGHEYPTASGKLNHSEAQYDAETTADVCTHGRTSLGLCDMAGNASEWVLDTYDGNWYGEMPEKDPVNLREGAKKVIRGGSSNPYFDDYLRAASRYSGSPGGFQTDVIGIRCVVAPSKP